MQICLAQLNATVGDLSGNAAKASAAYNRAVKAGADLVVLPELFLTGYPPEDLLLLPAFVQAAQKQLNRLAASIGKTPLILGAPFLASGSLFNAAYVLQNGRQLAVARKMHLPNYGVFDEKRYFAAGATATAFKLGNNKLGLTICEDLWVAGKPSSALAKAGCALLLNLSASPWHRGKQYVRQATFAARARATGLPVLACNMVGGQDELVFDGHSLAVDAYGNGQMAAGFCEGLLQVQVKNKTVVAAQFKPWPERQRRKRPAIAPQSERDLADALCLALSDYVAKNKFPGVLVGMSGGVDSALVGALAVRALGASKVHAVSMPSRYNSSGTKSDARKISKNLGIDFREISIEPVVQATLKSLKKELGDKRDWGLTAENMQARTRGQFLMSLSNRHGWLVVSTGNKSELAMGYATLYGDMVGGFALIKDLTKTWVYRLSRYLIDAEGMPIPASILTRAPSAELRENQTDQDSLPPYDLLDRILEAYIEQNASAADIVARGEPADVVKRVLRSVDRNEFKRRQGAPGPRVSERIFGKDRRMPITNGWAI